MRPLHSPGRSRHRATRSLRAFALVATAVFAVALALAMGSGPDHLPVQITLGIAAGWLVRTAFPARAQRRPPRIVGPAPHVAGLDMSPRRAPRIVVAPRGTDLAAPMPIMRGRRRHVPTRPPRIVTRTRRPHA